MGTAKVPENREETEMTKSQKLRIAAITAVCLSVFAISFDHITAVAQTYGNGWTSFLYPVCIDGVILVSALTLVARVGISKTTKVYAKAGRWFGFAATIYANVAVSGYASTDAILVNLIPAVSLIFTVELLIHAAQGTSASRSRTQRATTPVRLRAVK